MNDLVDAGLSHDLLLSLLTYCPLTGTFTWLKNSRVKPYLRGLVAGSMRSDGYLQIGINKKRYKQHRLAWFYFFGEWPSDFLDHIDANRVNNAISNLRVVNNSENMQNKKLAHKNNTAGFLGVVTKHNLHNTTYSAEIRINKKRYRLGTYSSAENAHAAYLNAKRNMHTHCTI